MSAPDETAPQPQDAAPKPCPLCSAAMKRRQQGEWMWWGHPKASDCILVEMTLWTPAHIAAWNRRAPSASEAALREALSVVLADIEILGAPSERVLAAARAALAAEGGAS